MSTGKGLSIHRLLNLNYHDLLFQHIKSVNAMVYQIRNFAVEIRASLMEVEKFCLFSLKGANETESQMMRTSELNVLSCKEFYRELDSVRTVKVSQMKKLFDSIGPTLIKLESIILNTYTGESNKMKQSYTFWEKEMYNSLIK